MTLPARRLVPSFALAISLLAGCDRTRPTTAHEVTPHPRAAGPKRTGTAPITLKTFDAIREGMSYDEVADIIGRDGEEKERYEAAGRSKASFTWSNPDGSSVGATFVNNALVSKSQYKIAAKQLIPQ
ncbi:Uncharacterized protein OS=Desmospora sp. 8437 GN=HMPREF9374_2182 PE=4 SV=1: DUF3862 [Gemmataceae bacterium]|nr:Uncharacterized protein OS=Desmospora sp. 8437 GN=HMPREF9374_2182 PE=4 SV=1: DUF3862 [Gemmataceae bacterium]VTU01043.1 Uncharacterized protein OS=Desmospora sp. 8437 GN=HMPREF9374_2182 PE=4 SV=1: DUF3862 [Gemmataceae bacterium]